MTPATTDNRLAAFFEQLRSQNPFRFDRVNGPSRTDVDVAGVHEAAFNKLTALAREACTSNHGIGAVLWGEPGAGKSHLLSRLWRWAEDDGASFVFLHNLHPDPERLPRYILKSVLSSLTHGRTHDFHDTALYGLVRAAVTEALRLDGPANIRSLPRIESAFEKLIDRLMTVSPANVVLLDRNVCRVLLRFYLSANTAHYKHTDDGLAKLAVDWLSGDVLEPEEARRLEVRPERGMTGAVALVDDQHIKQVLFALCQLSLYRKQPFILCFDQVDNLDAEKLGALARYLHALLDSSGNLFVLLSGVQDTLVRQRKEGVISESSWDRLGKEEIPVQRVTRSDGQRILAARLARFFEPLACLEELTPYRTNDPLFPLGREWFDDRFGAKTEATPRDLIKWANQRWSQQQERLESLSGADWLKGWEGVKNGGGKKVNSLEEILDACVEEKRAERKALLLARPHTLPPSADNCRGLCSGCCSSA
jgi:hypothetical protein